MSHFHYAFENKTFREVVAFSHEHLSQIARFDIDPFEGDHLHQIGMDIRLLPGPNIARMWSSPGTATRTKSHAADGNDNVVLVMPMDSEMVIARQGHRQIVCRPGEAYVWASDEPLAFAYHADCTSLCVSLPRETPDSFDAKFDEHAMRCLDADRAADLQLLRQYASLLVKPGGLSAEAERLAGAHLFDLAALILGRSRSPDRTAQNAGARAARLQAIKTDIAQNVHNPGLSIEWLAQRHRLSPRTIRNLFYGEDMNFSTYVLNARLERAKDDLLNPRLARRNIAAIAFDAGFGDLSWFNHAFRRRYGMTPSDMREQGRGSGEVR